MSFVFLSCIIHVVAREIEEQKIKFDDMPLAVQLRFYFDCLFLSIYTLVAKGVKRGDYWSIIKTSFHVSDSVYVGAYKLDLAYEI